MVLIHSLLALATVVNAVPAKRQVVVPSRVANVQTGSSTHGPYMGTPTVVGAANGPTTTASSVAAMGPNPTATYYNTNGLPQNPMPAPFTPAGGLGTNGSLPRYMVESDFDYESIALGLYQEWIELDLFNYGLQKFTVEEFAEAGVMAEDMSFIEFMANQEAGHATLLSNMLGETAPGQCTYDYPFDTVREFVDFCQRLTRFGESGVIGFLNHLDSREVGQLLFQSIATEARQQMAFRQYSGLFPMPVSFESGIPQSWGWSLLAPYISSCPANTTRLVWQNFPALFVLNNPNINRINANATAFNETTDRRAADPSFSTPMLSSDASCQNVTEVGVNCDPAITHNRSEPLSYAGKQVYFEWDAPGQAVGPNNSYVTSIGAGQPQFVAWVSQLNLTYSPLVSTGNNTGYTFQPEAFTYAEDPQINGTMFVALTDTNLTYTPFNLSMINPHVVALGMYMAG